MKHPGILLDSTRVKIMAIINYTADSFFDGGKYNHPDKFIERVHQCVEQGADILDIGVASTRPGASLIEARKEWEILKPLLVQIRQIYPDILISVDTYNAFTAEKSIENGVDIINDISGGTFDNKMLDVIASSSVFYVLMHTPDVPERMQTKTNYQHVAKDILKFMQERIQILHHKNFYNIIIDVGFGFGKTISQNYSLLKHLDEFQSLQKPILVGISRKSMIYKVLNSMPSHHDTLMGTMALHFVALLKGASILRVHDVLETHLIKTIFTEYEKAE